jgi:hypothetical protein
MVEKKIVPLGLIGFEGCFEAEKGVQTSYKASYKEARLA